MKWWRGWMQIALALGLVTAGCGGGNNNNNTPPAIVVTIAPTVAAVAVNGTLQFSAVVTGAKTATIASNGAARASNVVTITTTAAHGFAVGQIVVVGGVTDASFNGTFTIATVPSTTTFTYPQTGPDATSGSGLTANNTVTWAVNDTAGGNSTVGTITTAGLYTAPAVVPPATTATITATGAVRASNVVTITTTAAHGFFAGQVVTIAGVTDATFNGTFLIASVPSTTTFTYNQTAANASSGNGTAKGSAVTVKATSTADTSKSATSSVSLDSGIRVSVAPLSASVGLSETLQFVATVTGSANTAVNWSVNDVAGGNSTVGTISATGLYTAPATLPSPANVTITAASVADSARTGSASAAVITASDPTLTAISPTSAAQGSLFQDIYLAGTNFISTSRARVNGTEIPSVAVLGTIMRARIPAELLSTAGPVTIDVKRQSGFTTPTKTLTVLSVRPAMVGAVPDSGTQGGSPFSFNANGGYFGPAASPAVTAEFNGSVRTASISTANPARQLNITVGGAGSGDLDLPGLYSVAIRNSAAAAPMAATNLAVQPAPAITPPTVVATLPMGAGAAPSSAAVNTATGIAIVANRGTNSIQRIDLTTPVPALLGGPIAVGTSPTGVAVDNIGNRAVVVNNESKTLSVVNLATGAVSATIDLSTITTASPFAVGVNPISGLALIAFQSTNLVVIVDLNTNSVINAVSAGTGANPQVAVNPVLNWAMVTPGGLGTLGIFNMGLRNVNTIAAPATGASRASNSVTITTTEPHNLTTGQTVLIAGVTDASFNGAFTVASIPTTTSFTYAQAGANATSGNGTVSYAAPVATATIGTDFRGVAINPFTSKAILLNPANFGVTFMSTLDQAINTLNLPEAGAVAAAYNPFTDVAVTVNPNTDSVSLFDPRTPVRLATATIGVGTDPRAVAVDPGSNLAVVANETSNDVTILSLGAIRSLHLEQANIPLARQLSPTATLTSTTDLPLTLVGKGFLPGSIARLDGVALPAPTSVSDRQMTVTVPASFLSAPRRYALDVLNGSTPSNVLEFTVIQPVSVTSAGCTAPLPRAVAIDWQRDLAVVTNRGCNNVSLIDMTTGTVTKTVAVGTNPQGVAVIPRLGRAVVTNRGSANASVVDLVAGTVAGTVTVGTEPIGVAINQDTGKVVVANSVSNTIAFFFADAPGTATTTTTDQRPVAVAVDPFHNRAAVAHATDNTVGFFDLTLDSPPITNRVSGISLPTGLVFDPLSSLFIANASLGNQLFLMNPETAQLSTVRVGINPTSLAYNAQTGTFMTVNTTSGTISVLDFIERRVRHVLSLTGSQQFSVDIHPRTNLAVIADENNNRVLLVPLPN